ncbi:hypothetical protein JCM19239_2500 [Vibrio variabilis]|uniref:Flagellar hook-associated protein 2 C-terminal domain-containing protein n=1 Tax=Vibrio variabilis TaxID=990271 RepID=A0ABQ0JFJ2_9VIBR|nr:hypothetical protein JCM19239_2500 [Vibrio variabilis]
MVSGVDVTLKKANASGDTATSVQVSDDFSATLDSLQSFVDAYNSAVSEITNLTQSGGRMMQEGYLLLIQPFAISRINWPQWSERIMAVFGYMKWA